MRAFTLSKWQLPPNESCIAHNTLCWNAKQLETKNIVHEQRCQATELMGCQQGVCGISIQSASWPRKSRYVRRCKESIPNESSRYTIRSVENAKQLTPKHRPISERERERALRRCDISSPHGLGVTKQIASEVIKRDTTYDAIGFMYGDAHGEGMISTSH